MKQFTTLRFASKYRARFSVFIIALALCIGSGVNAQSNCGDVNNDGNVSIADATAGMAYLFASGPPPVNFDTSDADGWFLYTFNDVQRTISCAFSCDFEGPCTPGPSPLIPTPDSRYVFGYEGSVPGWYTEYGIRFGMGGESVDIASALAVLNVKIGSTPAQIDSVVFEPTVPIGASDPRDSGVVILAITNITGAPWDKNLMGRIYVKVPFSDWSQPVTLTWDTLTPTQAPVEQTGSLYPLFNPNPFGGGEFLPDLAAKCCWVPGDYNSDGAFNIADVMAGLGRIFGDGPGLNAKCWDQADANSDGAFNIADVTYGIARIFGGGPAPICGTTGS